MAKKLSASSRSVRQISASAESIWNKPLTKRLKAALEGVAKRQKRGDVAEIDYTDIPALTDKQLAFPFVRVADDPLGGVAKHCYTRAFLTEQ